MENKNRYKNEQPEPSAINSEASRLAQNRQKFWLIIAGIFFVFSIFLVAIVFWLVFKNRGYESGAQKSPREISADSKHDSGNLVRRGIDGVLTEPGNENIYPFAVVIDNHPDARPQYGLAGANLVIEAEVEGATTRYLAFFADHNEIDKIGPVRSVRPYFLDWTSEYSAALVHCGGSPEALARIAKESTIDINEFYKGDLFWRSDDRLAPHNVYTSSGNISRYLADRGLVEGKYFSWIFKDDSPTSSSSSASGIAIEDWAVKWEYDSESNRYLRHYKSLKQKDASGKEISAKNIIIMQVNFAVIDEELRLRMETIGQGQAVICLDGACNRGGWNKKSRTSRTRYYYESGEEVKFNAGTTWIEAVGPDYTVKY